jgi:hypothetical protein
MDRYVTVRFFRVDARRGSIPFSAALKQISQLALLEREVEIDEEIIVRLERFAPLGSPTRGELIRRQTSNLPPKALEHFQNEPPYPAARR